MIKTVYDKDFSIHSDDSVYEYQKKLTEKLDKISIDFNQEIINEIVLWKVNRYSELSENTLKLLNSVSNSSDVLDKELTRTVLTSLINESGIQLPMASTILRFRNPKIYQIIDQRVYRILYGTELKLSSYKSEVKLKSQIELYLEYLYKLRDTSEKLNIPFEKADRILYEEDKRINSNERLNNY